MSIILDERFVRILNSITSTLEPPRAVVAAVEALVGDTPPTAVTCSLDFSDNTTTWAVRGIYGDYALVVTAQHESDWQFHHDEYEVLPIAEAELRSISDAQLSIVAAGARYVSALDQNHRATVKWRLTWEDGTVFEPYAVDSPDQRILDTSDAMLGHVRAVQGLPYLT